MENGKDQIKPVNKSSSSKDDDKIFKSVQVKLSELNKIIEDNLDIEFSLSICIILIFYRSKSEILTLNEIASKVKNELEQRPNKIFSIRPRRIKIRILLNSFKRSVITFISRSIYINKIPDEKYGTLYSLNYLKVFRKYNSLKTSLKNLKGLEDRTDIVKIKKNETPKKDIKLRFNSDGKVSVELKNETKLKKKKINNNVINLKNDKEDDDDNKKKESDDENNSNTSISDKKDDSSIENDTIDKIDFIIEKGNILMNVIKEYKNNNNLVVKLADKKFEHIKSEISKLKIEIEEKKDLITKKENDLNVLKENFKKFNECQYENISNNLTELKRQCDQFAKNIKILKHYKEIIQLLNDFNPCDSRNKMISEYKMFYENTIPLKREIIDKMNLALQQNFFMEQITNNIFISKIHNSDCINNYISFQKRHLKKLNVIEDWNILLNNEIKNIYLEPISENSKNKEKSYEDQYNKENVDINKNV